MQDKIKLKQLFANNTDCYADTWQNIDAELHNGCHLLKEGAVIPAMTQDKFVEVVSQLLPTLTDAEIEAMAVGRYPDNGLARPAYERTAYTNGIKAILNTLNK